MTQAAGDSGEGPRQLDGFAWLADRLAAMSPAEIAFRFGEQFKRTVSRYYQPNFAHLVSAPLDPLPSLPGLADGLEALRGETELRSDWRQLVEQMRQGRFQALGSTWPDRPGPPDWHLDPSTQTAWPSQTYCFDISYRYAPERGDIKFVSELNRLQYLQPMAAVAALEDDEDLAELVVRHLESWIAAHRPYLGVAWISGIELALRVVSLLVVTTLIGERSFSAEFSQRLHLCLAAHGYWLARFPSRYSSANNHCIAEASGLYLLGSLVPTLRHAGAWKRKGKATLERELGLQFHDDGVGAEQSPTYGAFSLEWFLLCATVGGRAGDEWSNASWHRMVQAGHHLRAITDQNGNQPRIGDDDEGRVLCSLPGPEAHVNTVLGYLAVVTERPDLAPPQVTPHLGQALFGRPSPAQRRQFEYNSFPAGGYTAVREWREGEENLWVMDHGPLGYLSIAAHGHADTLSLWLHIAGRPVLVDAGTYLYHSGGPWREHFRATTAHNTLSIMGVNSSTIAGAFNWSHKAQGRLLNTVVGTDHWLIEGEHDGYESLTGYHHRRRLERLGNDGVQLTDSLHGSGLEEPVEVGFLVAPGLEIHRDADGWLVTENGRRLLLIAHMGRLHGWVEDALEKPMRSWHSPSFGHRLPAKRLVFTGRMGAGDAAVFNFKTRF
ncbi:MAG: alginate lyase family protein [Rhodospirillaceae bacterium]|jgi:hypothetical protein|nr:alginate lyase family protein [Rhodospirillaceae bacterium]MBT5191913.1 alginate lyase family protein [Rhodospirillaceae bacterium]